MDQSIETRLARLEAIEACRALKMKYARLCDSRYPPVELSELFVEDGVWDGGPKWGKHVGRAAIQEFFRVAESTISWAMHYTVSGDIKVADDLKSAVGRWYLWQPMTTEVEGKKKPVILIADYLDHYVKGPKGQWLYKSLELHVQILTTLEDGWVKKPMI